LLLPWLRRHLFARSTNTQEIEKKLGNRRLNGKFARQFVEPLHQGPACETGAAHASAGEKFRPARQTDRATGWASDGKRERERECAIDLGLTKVDGVLAQFLFKFPRFPVPAPEHGR